MKTLLLVTVIDFWKQGSGHRERVSSIIKYLQNEIQITVVYGGNFSEDDQFIVNRDYDNITIELLQTGTPFTYKEFSNRFELFVNNRFFNYVIVEYIQLSFVLPFIDPASITLLDTHDLTSDRIESFDKHNIPYSDIRLTEPEEIEVFRCFDYIIVIKPCDKEKLGKRLARKKILTVPHPVTVSRKKLREKVENIGFVASAYAPNVDGITWFLVNVWPDLYADCMITLNIYGKVCTEITEDIRRNTKGVNFHGFVSELSEVYNHCDVMINPVRAGAGLKIKNLEALGNGLPLVTTTHGASGIEKGVSISYMIADTAQEFINSIKQLVLDYDFRVLVGNNAHLLAKRYFSADKCYQPLMKVIANEPIQKS
jgi:glycosyltransferase involved in cell wall biosynthesis